MRLRTSLILLAVLLSAVTIQAQVRIGIKGGIAVNKIHFDKSFIESDNRAGFSGGLQLELSLPITGLGLDASLLYSHRKDALVGINETYRRDYVEIPIHVKYGVTIMGLNRFLVPYAFTGPNFSFLFNESSESLWENRSSNTAWDLGLGVEFFHHLQLQAAYTISLTDSFKQNNYKNNSQSGKFISGRDRCWTVTAAYLF